MCVLVQCSTAWPSCSAHTAFPFNLSPPLRACACGACAVLYLWLCTHAQGLLGDIVAWCERGTSAYRFEVHESAVSKASARYSSASAANNNNADGKEVREIDRAHLYSLRTTACT